MAGHSKWANIQHRKGRQDAARSKLFSKLSKEITVAAKMGDPDPEKNPRLRLAVKEAKSNSVPKDVIDRAIKKATGGDAETYDEIRYEGYGPSGVAVIVETMTDNKNRTASTVRSTFSKNGGNLGETGSVGFMFERKGEVAYPAEVGDADTVMMAAIEAWRRGCGKLRGRSHRLLRGHRSERRVQRAGGRAGRERQHQADLEAHHHHRVGPGRHAKADAAGRCAGRRRRRAAGHHQLRGLRRGDGAALSGP